MPTIFIVIFVAYFIMCLITGLLSGGKGHKTDNLLGVWGVILILAGIAAIVYCIIQKQWLYIAVVIAIFFVGIRIGGSIMKKALSKNHEKVFLYGANKNVTTSMPQSTIQMDKNELMKYSMQKSEIMKKIEKYEKERASALENGNISKYLYSSKDMELELFTELYDCMNKMPVFHEILEAHNVTPKLLKSLEGRIALAGFPDMKGYYIPVALVSLKKPLNYILENKDVLLNHGINEIRPIVRDAIQFL